MNRPTPTIDRPRERRWIGQRYADLYTAIEGAGPRPLAIVLAGWGQTIDGEGPDLPGELGEPFPLSSRLIERTDCHLLFCQAEGTGIRRNWREKPVDGSNPDVMFVRATIAGVATRLGNRLDLGRVWLLGFSDGARLIDLLLRLDRYSAAIRHSGAQNRHLGGRIGAARKTPVYCVAGQGKLFSIERKMRKATVAAEALYRREGHPTELDLQPGKKHRWIAERNAAFWDFLYAEG